MKLFYIHTYFKTFLITLLSSSFSVASYAIEKPKKPNVVFIILDDMNDYVGFLKGHPQTQTPNLDRLANRAIVFENAYATVPVCAPSRASLFTGIYPFHSNVYGFNPWYKNETLKNSKTLIEYFSENGYKTYGAGKIMHHKLKSIWNEFGPGPDYGPVWYDGEKTVAHPSVPIPFHDIGPIDGSYAPMTQKGTNHDSDHFIGWYSKRYKKPFVYHSDNNRDELPDELTANWGVQELQKLDKQKQPFFMALGMLKPHTPLHVPEKYFKMHPLKNIQLPDFIANDIDDTHYKDNFSNEMKGPRYYRLIKEAYKKDNEGIKRFIQAYLACISFVDEQIGKVINQIENSSLKENTIIVLTSDHGFNMGHKNYLFKNALWEKSTRVPLLIYDPSSKHRIIKDPVSLIDLYPTLKNLCHLSGDTKKNSQGADLDGKDLTPYIIKRKLYQKDTPFALSLIKTEGNSSKKEDQHYSIRTKKWRYILYSNGDEELYKHHNQDRRETKNLAYSTSYQKKKKQLKELLLTSINP
ncbi:N-acetylglucosamine-6-sulfatase [Flavobacteriaceae bacterium UJ101]|nr:N-acetylglucosamine-6-sulfatase [Flavobacteriaceae bacterium UJ101]